MPTFFVLTTLYILAFFVGIMLFIREVLRDIQDIFVGYSDFSAWNLHQYLILLYSWNLQCNSIHEQIRSSEYHVWENIVKSLLYTMNWYDGQVLKNFSWSIFYHIQVEQLHRIFRLCGTPPEDYWRKLKLCTSFRPPQPYKPSILETFKDFPSSALGLLTILLSLEPSYRGTAASALQSEVN